MEKKQFDLCLEILRRFNRRNLLKEIILIGSWCLPFYKEYFRSNKAIDDASLKTRDIDFLIPRPSRISHKVDVPDLVKDLGFVPSFGGKGYMKLPHPANFALHKLIVSGKRKDRVKAEKDFRMAIDLLEALIEKGDQAIVKKIFDSAPSKWRAGIVADLDRDVHRRILAVLKPA